MDIGFVAYVISIISLGVSLYVLYLLSEMKSETPNQKDKNQIKPPSVAKRPKGNWD